MMMTLVGAAIVPTTLPANTACGTSANTLCCEGATTGHLLRHTLCGAVGDAVNTSAQAVASSIRSSLLGTGTALRANADIRIRNNEAERSRPDRSVHRELEDFVATLSGVQLVLMVLVIVIPDTVATPLLGIFILGGRCDKCGRHHAMRITQRDALPYDGTVTRRGRPVHKRLATRVCRHCGHTDTIEEADH